MVIFTKERLQWMKNHIWMAIVLFILAVIAIIVTLGIGGIILYYTLQTKEKKKLYEKIDINTSLEFIFGIVDPKYKTTDKTDEEIEKLIINNPALNQYFNLFGLADIDDLKSSKYIRVSILNMWKITKNVELKKKLEKIYEDISHKKNPVMEKVTLKITANNILSLSIFKNDIIREIMKYKRYFTEDVLKVAETLRKKISDTPFIKEPQIKKETGELSPEQLASEEETETGERTIEGYEQLASESKPNKGHSKKRKSRKI